MIAAIQVELSIGRETVLLLPIGKTVFWYLGSRPNDELFLYSILKITLEKVITNFINLAWN